MSVVRRRTASVIITGSSNLPADKLMSLSSAINKIVQIIVETYNACEDNQQERFDKLAPDVALEKDIDQLVYCLGEEMNVCSEPVRNSMKHKYNEVTINAQSLKHLLEQYSPSSPSRYQLLKSIYEKMLQLVNDAVDLLKIADQHFVDRLVNEANLTLVYLKQVREADTIGDLVVATQDYTAASVQLAKRLSKRIDSGVLPNEYKQDAQQALEILRNECANVVNVKRNHLSFPGNETHSVALGSTVQTVVSAVKTVLDIARVDPKFSVDFQIDVIEDEFGLMLARLVDAVEQCNQSQVVSMLGQIIKEVSHRSINSGLVQEDAPVKKARSDLAETRDAANQCLQARLSGMSNTLIVEATTRLDTAIKRLRQSYHALGDSKATPDRTNIRKAAESIIANLDKLILSI